MEEAVYRQVILQGNTVCFGILQLEECKKPGPEAGGYKAHKAIADGIKHQTFRKQEFETHAQSNQKSNTQRKTKKFADRATLD